MLSHPQTYYNFHIETLFNLFSMKRYLRFIGYLLSIHIVAILLLTIFRVVFYYCTKSQLSPDVAGETSLIASAFLRGLWFDNVVACYLTALPLVVGSMTIIMGLWREWMYKVVNWWFGLLYVLVFMAEAANIPYYIYFSKLLNASIWNWTEYGTTTMGMIFGEKSYYGFILLFVATSIAFAFFLVSLRKLFFALGEKEKNVERKALTIHYVGMVGISIALYGACFMGIRGRLGYNPIKVSAAYFCNNPVLNNMGVNPVFALLYSTLDEMRPENQTLHLMSETKAMRNVQTYYGREGIKGLSPLARTVSPKEKPTKQNVVIVFMESLSAQLMKRFGNTYNLTPNLDSLWTNSLSFANCYSAGNHTNQGLYATLYSFPSIMLRNAMKGTNIPTYTGLPSILKAAGYSTMFFMTHESQYDNMNAFFRTNGYDEIYSQENYPKEKVVNHFGVSDDYLFEYALPVLRKKASNGIPFFATLLTISNHPPYVVPERFQDSKLTTEQQIVHYADDCIGQFMRQIKKEAWAKNTIFVFLGDHGKLVGAADCELPESFNHIPLIIHGTSIAAEEKTQFVGQVDIAPTLLGMLHIPYTQNNLGLDILNDAPRPAAFYSADKTIAARTEQLLYIYNNEQKKEYCYLIKDGLPMPTQFSPSFLPLKEYVFSLLQCTEYMVQRGMTHL